MKQVIIQRFDVAFNKLESGFAILASIGLILHFLQTKYSHIFLILGLGGLSLIYFIKGHSVSKLHDIPVFKIFASTLLFWGLSLTGLGILFFLNNYTAPKVLLFIGLFTVFFSSIILFTKYLKDTNGNIRGQLLRIIIWFSLGLYCLLSWFSMT